VSARDRTEGSTILQAALAGIPAVLVEVGGQGRWSQAEADVLSDGHGRWFPEVHVGASVAKCTRLGRLEDAFGDTVEEILAPVAGVLTYGLGSLAAALGDLLASIAAPVARAITWNVGGAVPPRRCRGGRMSADPPGSPVLRASDADRDRVIDVLRAAVADGRLDPAEFDERLDAALAARTIDALVPLTADLIAAAGSGGALALPLATTPGGPAVELLTINEKHGSVRRDGRWRLPHRLALRTAWCDVMLDLTSAVRSGPELIIEMRVRGGDVELVLAPGMVVDANELSVRHTRMAISRDAGDDTPETLCVRLVGRMKHGRIDTRWLAPRR